MTNTLETIVYNCYGPESHFSANQYPLIFVDTTNVTGVACRALSKGMCSNGLECPILNLRTERNSLSPAAEPVRNKITLNPIELTIGGTTKDELLARIKQAGIKVGSHTNGILKSDQLTTLVGSKRKLTLAKVSIGDLFTGDVSECTYEGICEAAQGIGLERCPAEVALHLALNDKDLIKGRSYNIAMDSILSDEDIWPRILYIQRDVFSGNITIESTRCNPNGKRSRGDKFMFVVKQ